MFSDRVRGQVNEFGEFLDRVELFGRSLLLQDLNDEFFKTTETEKDFV